MWFNMILLQHNKHFKVETQTLFRDELNKTLYCIKYCAFIILLPTVGYIITYCFLSGAITEIP